jgi:hypothetical protein
MPDYEHLHEAGYNVLCYDMRNFGHSGGIGSNGIFESRDVIGSLQYVTAREDLRDMTVGLFSRCCGGNATMIAMTNHPKYFKDHPVHGHPAAGLFAPVLRAHHRNPRHHRPDRRHRPGDRAHHQLHHGSDVAHPVREERPRPDLHHAGTRRCADQAQRRAADLRQHSVKDKKLFWIEGTTRRWDGYNYFPEHPKLMIEWFDTHMQ